MFGDIGREWAARTRGDLNDALNHIHATDDATEYGVAIQLRGLKQLRTGHIAVGAPSVSEFSNRIARRNRYRIKEVVVGHIDEELRRGRLRVDFYDEKQIYLESRILEAGDVILLATGGHCFEVLEEIEMIEVKQGPYAGDADKTRFEPQLPDQFKFR